jgi:signal transduction histidine kinase
MTTSELVFPIAPIRPTLTPNRAQEWNSFRERVLRAPLVAKLLGANILIALAAAAASSIWGHPALVAFICAALAISFAINTFLVRLALSPLDDLQRVAECVSHGESYVRVSRSAIADRRIERLGKTFNRLLDDVNADRLHIHQLIRRGLGIREAERGALSRQLRETTAQQLSAVVLQLAAAELAFGEAPGLAALRTARHLSTRMLDDVRRIADSVYPGLLQELGLPAALAALATRVRNRSRLRVSVHSPDIAAHLAPALRTAIYHVAEEAVQNAERHADARSIRIHLTSADGILRLEVIDDGRGFDVAAMERGGLSVGLFEARELLASVHAQLQIDSSAASGTRVMATAPMDQGET